MHTILCGDNSFSDEKVQSDGATCSFELGITDHLQEFRRSHQRKVVYLSVVVFGHEAGRQFEIEHILSGGEETTLRLEKEPGGEKENWDPAHVPFRRRLTRHFRLVS